MKKIKMTNISTKKSEIISLDDFINEMNISSELRKFNDDDFKFEVIDDKKSDAEKLAKLEKKYKQLAEKHRKDRQAEYPRRNQDRQRVQRMYDIITTLIEKMYKYIPDKDICDVEIEIEKIIKNA